MISIIFIINTLALPNFEALRFLNSPLLKSSQWKQSGSSSPLSNFFPTRTLYIHKNTCPSFQRLPKNFNKNTLMHTKNNFYNFPPWTLPFTPKAKHIFWWQSLLEKNPSYTTGSIHCSRWWRWPWSRFNWTCWGCLDFPREWWDMLVSLRVDEVVKVFSRLVRSDCEKRLCRLFG